MLKYSEKSLEKNRFLPPNLQSYGDLFWEVREEWIDLDDNNSIKAFLETKDITRLYQEEYFRNITVPENERESFENNLEEVSESIKKDFNTIVQDSINSWVPLNEIFFYKYLPTYLSDGESFKIVRREKNRRGEILAATTLRDDDGSSLFLRRDYPNLGDYGSKKVTFWYVNEEWDWDYDMRREYHPWDVLVMSDIITNDEAISTHCPMINGFLDWKNNPHLPWLLDWLLEFSLQKTREWNLSYEEIDIQNFKIQHLQKLVVWYEQSLDHTVWKIQECKRTIDSHMTSEEIENENANMHGVSLPSRGAKKTQTQTKSWVERVLNLFQTKKVPNFDNTSLNTQLINHLREHYLYVARLIREIEDYFEKHPDASAKEIISNTINHESYKIITKEQWKVFYDTIEGVCALQKIIESHRDEITNDPIHFICDSFWIDKNSIKWRLHLEIWVWVVQVYTETEEDYLALVKDPELAEKSGGIAIWEAKKWIYFNIIKTANIEEREGSHSTTVHEYRHQQNKKTMAEHVLSRLNKNKWPWKKFITRWKDEIIAQFKWGDRSVEQIVSTMTADEWLYDYYFQEYRNAKITDTKFFMNEIFEFFGPELEEVQEIKKNRDLFTKKDFEKVQEWFFGISPLIHSQYTQEELEELEERLEHFDSSIKNVENYKGTENWQQHKEYMRLYINQAHDVIQKYWDDAFHLLAVTPIEQWRIL